MLPRLTVFRRLGFCALDCWPRFGLTLRWRPTVVLTVSWGASVNDNCEPVWTRSCTCPPR
jgi:hypothetical protein